MRWQTVRVVRVWLAVRHLLYLLRNAGHNAEHRDHADHFVRDEVDPRKRHDKTEVCVRFLQEDQLKNGMERIGSNFQILSIHELLYNEKLANSAMEIP